MAKKSLFLMLVVPANKHQQNGREEMQVLLLAFPLFVIVAYCCYLFRKEVLLRILEMILVLSGER